MIKNLIDWTGIYDIVAAFHIYLTARGRGKTDTKAWQFLEEITSNNDVCFAWIRRRWHDSLDCSKPYFQDLTYKFCEKTGIKYSSFEFHEKGVYYHSKRRIYFCDLFSFSRFRGQIARVTFKEIIFEEAIPIDGEFLVLHKKTELKTEQWMFNDLIDSLKKRKDKDGQEIPFKTKITFLGNPYIWSAWFLDAFYKNLINLKKLAEEKEKKEDNGGVLEKVKDEEGTEWLLYINLIEGEEDPHSRSLREKINPFLVNWDDFMISLYTKGGGIKKYKIEHAVQDFFFCELGEREVNKKYFLMHFTKNKKEVDSDITNYCFNLEEKAKSKLKECVLRDKDKLMSNWVNMLKDGELFFTDFRSRDWFLEQIKTVR
ncbi:protein of unknown function [endosymbiont DhMRE of Dentiscutata heterogama]|uniref:hypothetical protein n=1 Tax=endosymbiont DhMRE of Dentiscutata heterogama TaxID=1609546 RepID=UPI000629D611|nr:hypothetical protein [endosymbiont DhMRE of Dentiscutata heterogama]CFW92991.1 protein of unknown function [endosymbiont DhMRE of Dentiscutata heterogama]